MLALFIPPRIQAASGDFPHMLFYGPSGAGKKTRIACTLKELFGKGVEKVSSYSTAFLCCGLMILAQNRPTSLPDAVKTKAGRQHRAEQLPP